MRTAQYHASSLVDVLRRGRVLDMAALKAAIGKPTDMTVFRKLRSINYLTSYSHGGRFYALLEMAEFDESGLWSWQGVHFSREGTLVDTVCRFVTDARAGVVASELDEALGVQTKDALLKLWRCERLAREQLGGVYVYCSAEARVRRRQLAARRSAVPDDPFGELPRFAPDAGDELRAAMILFLSTLDEKQRRLFAGVESLRLGRGGDQRVADWTGLDVHTVARGRHELLSGDIELHGVRRPGAGRPAVEKKRHRSSPPSND